MTNMHLLNRGTQGAGVKNVFAILLAASALLLLPGCRNLLDPSGRGAGTGTLSLTINGQGPERTITPDSPTLFDRFGLEFTDLSGGNCFDDYLYSTSDTIPLTAGDWRLNVTAQLSDGAGGYIAVAHGSLEFTVAPGQTVAGNVVLSPIERDGYYGTFSWNIILHPNIENSIAVARMNIVRISEGGETEWGTFYLDWGDGTTTQNSGEFDNMPAGQYRVTLTLMNHHGENAVIHEILHVYRNMESNFTKEFTLAHFPVSLQRYILSAWDSESQSWDFDAIGITAEHFTHAWINGVTSDNFHARDRTGLIYWFNVVQYAAGPPYNLEALVDAALIRMVFPPDVINADNYPDRPSVMTAIAGEIRNRSNIQFDWSSLYPSDDPSNTVIVSVGHSYWITITFDRSIYVPALGYLAARLAWLREQAQSGNTYTIYIPANETLEPHSLDFGYRTNISIVLRGAGETRTVNLAPWQTGSILTVGSGITLELDSNITLQGRDGNSQALVRVNSGGTLVMRDGSKITDNISVHGSGGGVIIGYGGTFNMYGGIIANNTASFGGGVNVSPNGTFNMHNGTISHNAADSHGGGVYVGGTGTFTMNGGEITENTTPNSGGGVHVRGTFVLSGGSIAGNAATSSGGGVHVGYEGVFQMTDGVIYGTDAEEVLRNTSSWDSASLERCCCATAAQFGTFNSDGSFTRWGDFTSTNATICMVNGVLQAQTLFDLATNQDIQDMSPGQPWYHVLPYLERAGYAAAVSIETAGYQGRNALRVTTTAFWAGFDLRHYDGFNFQPGDFIRIVGIAETDNRIILNSYHAGVRPLGDPRDVSAGDTFVIQHTLTEEDVNAISATNPPAIRVRGNTAGAVFYVTDLTVIRWGSDADNYLPDLTGNVTIDGTPQVGETLTAVTDDLSGTGTISFQWRRGSVSIDGETGPSYNVQLADVGYNITVRVTRAGILGSITSEPTATVYINPVDIWQAVISSPYISGRNATLTATPEGILVSGRGTGEHNHNNGLAFNLDGLRGLADTANPVIVFTGTASTAGAMQTQGLSPNVNTSFTAGGTWTVTIPFSTILHAEVSGGQLWGGPAPMLGTNPGQNFDYTITGITVGGVDIWVLLAGDGTPTVTGVIVTPATVNVAPGETRSFTARVAGLNNPPQDVTWSIAQANRDSGTTISSDGFLTVSPGEQLSVLTVRATSVADPTRNGTATVLLGEVGRVITLNSANSRSSNDGNVATRVNNFDWEAWTDARGVGPGSTMIIYTDGSFSSTWSETFNTLFRVGRRFPGQGTRLSDLGAMSLRYAATDFWSTNGATYLCVYGWTRGRTAGGQTYAQIEWYIVDYWRNWVNAGNVPVGASTTVRPPSVSPNYEWHGVLNSNGNIYDIITGWRVDQPAIEGGNATFLQIFSVRRGSQLTGPGNNLSGTIDLSAHFERWNQIGPLIHDGTGTRAHWAGEALLYEISFTVEGFGGASGSSGRGTVTALCIRYGPNSVCTSPGGCEHCL